VGIGTARMAHLSLPSSTLRVGIDFARDPVVRATVGSAGTYVLYPGDDALDVRELAAGAIRTLVVLDGTWANAATLLKANPPLRALPRVAFTPARPSEYRIRRQPAAECLSTIEALAEVLHVLEPDGGPFARLLAPFAAMVERQEWFETEVRSSRHSRRMRARRNRVERPTLAMRLTADWPRLVCVQGEANGWPIDDPGRQDPEIVHFAACRVATGEHYERVVAPRLTLAPSTPSHIELPAPSVLGGCDLEDWRRSWQAFLRPDDVLVTWGNYHVDLAAAEGLPLPAHRIDLRRAVMDQLQLRVGTVEAYANRLGAALAPLAVDGRCGRRLASLLAVVRSLNLRQSC
jgi:DTW domain-containing protein YfiP